MFRKGDVVKCRDSSEIGIVDGPVGSMPNETWVIWTHGNDAGQRLHCSNENLALLSPCASVENVVTEYTVEELKRMISKMDDSLVFYFSDLKISS